jgi:4-carboxymuconolactone decarboxylase
MPLIELPGIPIPAVPKILQEAADRGALINVFRMMLRSPALAGQVVLLGSVQLANDSLSAIDRELAVLTVGVCSSAPYITAQHGPISAAVGVTDGQRAAVATKEWDSEVFDPAQRALMGFVAATVRGPNGTNDGLSAVLDHFSERQVVDLVILTGYYFLLARVSTVFDIPLDPPADDRVLQAGLHFAQARAGVA